MTADFGTLNRDYTIQEDGYKSHLLNILAGSTYAINAHNTLGLALTLQQHTGDYLSGGDFKDTATGMRIIESYHPTDNFFMQAVAGYDSVSSQRNRAAEFTELSSGSVIFSQSGTPYADYKYNQTELALMAGYNYSAGSFTLTPQLGLTWLNADYGTYSEAGSSGLELTIHNDKRESLQSSLGILGSNTISTSFGVMIPQFEVRWKHEFADKSRQVDVSFVGDTRGIIFSYDTQATDRNFFEVGAGLGFVYAKGVQSFIRIQTIVGQQYYHGTTATLGLNMEL